MPTPAPALPALAPSSALLVVWRRRLPGVAAAWTAGYAVVRLALELTDPPRLSPIGTDLVGVTGWPSVLLWSAGAVLAAQVARVTARPDPQATARGLVAAALAVAGLMAVSSALFLLDVVAALFPGIGVALYPWGALSRVGAAGSAVLLAASAAAVLRRGRAVCQECERPVPRTGRLEAVPRWARWAAGVAAAGCLVRIVAQAVVGFDESPMSAGMSMVLFEGGFLLAGTLLPAALVFRFGRVWPRWVIGLSGRRIPRMLVLAPATAISSGMTVYFGFMLVQMVFERLQGRNPFPPSGGLDLPEAFFWVSVPAYVAWALGLSVATHAYHRLTRPHCPGCAR